MGIVPLSGIGQLQSAAPTLKQNQSKVFFQLLQNRTQRQGEYILQELEKRHIQPAEILESSNIRAAAALAANGYGVGFLSGELLEHLELNIPFGAYPLQNCTLHIESVAAWRTGDYLPRYAQAFIKLMEQV